jgi:hypothetical protein
VSEAEHRLHTPTLFRQIFAIDARSLAAFRIALGLMVTVDMLLRLRDVEAHYSDLGVWTRDMAWEAGAKQFWNWSLQLLDGSPQFSIAVLLVTALAGLWLAGGRYSRWAAVVVWLLVWSVQNRNTMVNTGGDTLLRLLLFWHLFLPSGLVWSMDSLNRRDHPKPDSIAPPSINNAATAAFLLQVCMMYWFTALWKSHAVWRESYTAVEQALRIESFQGPLAPLLLAHPEFLKLATRATLLLEELGPILALFPLLRFGWLRGTVALSFMAFHLLGLAPALRLGTFPWVCAIAWLLFLPPVFWKWLGLGEAKPPARVISEVNPQCLRWLPPVLLAYVFLWNFAFLYRETAGWLMPEPLRTLGRSLGINQRWPLFAPRPLSQDGWYVATVLLESGRVVDPRTGAIPTFARPMDGVANTYPNHRWHKFMGTLFQRRNASQIDCYVRYLQSQWNENHPNERALEAFIFFMMTDRYDQPFEIRIVTVRPYVVTGGPTVSFPGQISKAETPTNVPSADD